MGDDVTTVSPGQHVVLTWIVSCRTCPHCLRGETQLCLHAYDHAYGAPYAESASGPVWPGMGVGSLAEETLLPAAAVVPVGHRRCRWIMPRCWAAASPPVSARWSARRLSALARVSW